MPRSDEALKEVRRVERGDGEEWRRLREEVDDLRNELEAQKEKLAKSDEAHEAELEALRAEMEAKAAGLKEELEALKCRAREKKVIAEEDEKADGLRTGEPERRRSRRSTAESVEEESSASPVPRAPDRRTDDRPRLFPFWSLGGLCAGNDRRHALALIDDDGGKDAGSRAGKAARASASTKRGAAAPAAAVERTTATTKEDGGNGVPFGFLNLGRLCAANRASAAKSGDDNEPPGFESAVSRQTMCTAADDDDGISDDDDGISDDGGGAPEPDAGEADDRNAGPRGDGPAAIAGGWGPLLRILSVRFGARRTEPAEESSGDAAAAAAAAHPMPKGPLRDSAAPETDAAPSTRRLERRSTSGLLRECGMGKQQIDVVEVAGDEDAAQVLGVEPLTKLERCSTTEVLRESDKGVQEIRGVEVAGDVDDAARKVTAQPSTQLQRSSTKELLRECGIGMQEIEAVEVAADGDHVAERKLDVIAPLPLPGRSGANGGLLRECGIASRA